MAAAAAFAPAAAAQHAAQREEVLLDSLTVEALACGAQERGAEAAAWPMPYRMHVRRGGPDLAEVQQVRLPVYPGSGTCCASGVC